MRGPGVRVALREIEKAAFVMITRYETDRGEEAGWGGAASGQVSRRKRTALIRNRKGTGES